MPVNHVSKIICELAGLDGEACVPHVGLTNGEPQVYHVVNPSSRPWSTLVPTVTAGLGLDTDKNVIPWVEWLAALEASETAGDYENNPGLNLIPFYRSVTTAGDAGRQLAVLQTILAQKRSPTLKSMEAVSPTWMDEWMTQWAF